MIHKNHLENRVFLKGATNDVPNVLQQGDIFAFPSAYEGFGMALGEAMSMGLPAIGYKNCSAVNELIEDGKNGYLCEDGVKALQFALQKLMKNQSLRVQLGINAKKSMRKYSSKIVWNMWEKLLKILI